MKNINTYDPRKHHRKSIRLKGYNYSQKGWYLITLCTKNREKLFGEVVDGKMKLNQLGNIAEDEWKKTEEIRKNINIVRETPSASIWQNNYYERVIRNEPELNRIRNYILQNPLNWGKDKYF